jgi:hypothetical protein
MKTTSADTWFSKAVRERAGWRCERCGKWYDPSAARGLDCSHFIGRGNWSVRFDPRNAFAHCMGCHAYFEANPHEFVEWTQEKLNGSYDSLLAASRDVSIGKNARKAKKQIATHYRKEYERMVGLRSALGVARRIEVVNWSG